MTGMKACLLMKTVLLFAVIQSGHGKQHQQLLRAESEVSLCSRDVGMADSRDIVAFMTHAARQTCWAQRYQFSNVGGNPHDLRYNQNDNQRCNFLAEANRLQSCHDWNEKEIYQKAVSNVWCPEAKLINTVAMGGVAPADSYEVLWQNRYGGGGGANVVINKHGIQLTMRPFSSHDMNGDPPNQAQPIPNPTACRKSSDGDPRKNHISNTYISTFASAVPAGFGSFTHAQVRHGVLGFKKPTAGVMNDFVRLVAGAGGRKIVSIDLLSDLSVDGGGHIKNQNKVLSMAEEAHGRIKVVKYNWGVNWGGINLGDYAKANGPQHIKQTQLILREVIAQLRAPYQPGGPGQTRAVPNVFVNTAHCNAPGGVRGRGLQWRRSWPGLVYGSNVNPGDELDRIATVLDDIDDYTRRATRCVMGQLRKLLGAGPAMLWIPHTAHGDLFEAAANPRPGTHALGSTGTQQRHNTIRGIDIFLALVSTDGSAKNRMGDVLRTTAMSTFFGFDAWVNCKSGLDRTGAVAPVMAAFSMLAYSMVDPAAGTLPTACLDLLSKMAVRYSRTLARHVDVDKYQDDYWAGTNPALAALPAMQCNDVQHANDLEFLHNANNPPQPNARPTGDGIRLVSLFQSLVLEIAVQTSLPISLASSGVIGVKWQKDALAKTFVQYVMPGGQTRTLTHDGDFVSASKKRCS